MRFDTVDQAEAFRPGRLWSLWDMIELHAQALYLIGESIAVVRAAIVNAPLQNHIRSQTARIAEEAGVIPHKKPWFVPHVPYKQDQAIELKASLARLDANLDQQRRVVSDRLLVSFEIMDDQFGRLGLTVSRVLASRMQRLYVSTQRLPELNDIDDLNSRIVDELTLRKLLFIETGRASFYEAGELLFGESVADAFPLATADLAEAGKCYALGRWTACVFHLMRIVEIGMRQLCDALGTDFPEKGSWAKVLNDRLEPAINALPEGDRKTGLQQARAHLHAIRLAWRNDTMHPKATYTDEEAGEVLRNVETFMKHLAGKLI